MLLAVATSRIPRLKSWEYANDLEIKLMMVTTAGFTDYLKAPDRCAGEKKREYDELYRKCEQKLLDTPAPF